MPLLPAEEAAHWWCLIGIGSEAEPLPTGVMQLQPSADHAWGQAVRQLRGNVLLVESVRSRTGTPGPGLDVTRTDGCPPGGWAW